MSDVNRRSRLRPFAVWGMVVMVAAGLGIGSATRSEAAKKRAEATADELAIVDCLLPPKVRRLGRRSTTLVARKPARLTIFDCQLRGGEYTEPDQANLGTALKVWLPQAQAGDAEAQYYVGQMFERGLGVDPDFASAASWYRKAAEQGYAAAQINLGSLYETGRGVEQDGEEALRWYRRAAGLAEDLVVLQAAEYDELTDARRQLEEASGEMEELRREIEQLRSSKESGDEQRRRLAEQVARLEEKSREVDTLRQAVEQLRAGDGDTPLPPPAEVAFGDYHALVIGVSNYAALDPVPDAAASAKKVAATLEQQYGFDVDLRLDASRLTIMRALNELRETLTPDDNLLVFYAGHAHRDPGGARAYWQPADADPVNPVNWIPTELISEHLDLIPARHVLLVADAVFAGLRTRSSVAQLRQGMSDEERTRYIRALREKRCRLVLTSGGVGERADTGFADDFVAVLESNPGVLEASLVYRELVRKQETGEAPAPEFASMRWARNEIADFFFVRNRG